MGCGPDSMGDAIAWRLLQEPCIVYVTDKNPQNIVQTFDKLEQLPRAKNAKLKKIKTEDGSLDVLRQKTEPPIFFKNADIVISALPADLNPGIADSVLFVNEKNIKKDGKLHYCDLGGVTRISEKMILDDGADCLSRRAAACGVSLVPDCGLQPGLGGVLGMYLLSQLDLKEPLKSLKIEVGGLPQNPIAPPFYKKLFSLNGLEEIYFKKALVLRSGKLRKVKGISEESYEILDYGDFLPFICTREKKLETAITGGLGTLPYFLKKHVLNLEEKTLRWPGHYEIIRNIPCLNFTQVFEKMLAQREKVRQSFGFTGKEPDFVVLRVIAIGKDRWSKKLVKLERALCVLSDENWTSMQKATGFSAAVMAKLVAKGVAAKGGFPPEIALRPELVLSELKNDFSISECKYILGN